LDSYIQFKNVTYTYPLSSKSAVKNITCNIERGKCYGIIGPNASGKSTLCNMIRGLIPHFYKGELEGDVLIDGKNIRELDDSELSILIGYVFQDPFAQLSGIKETVFEEIGLGLENLGVPLEAMVEQILSTAKLVKIDHLLKNDPRHLSGGQCQRLAFASVLVLNSDTIVIDEPTSQLDPEGTSDVFEIIKTLKDMGKTIIITEHKIDLLAQYCDQVIAMSKGVIVDFGPVRNVLNNAELIENNITIPHTVQMARVLEKAGKTLPFVPLVKEEAITLLKERMEK
jgi:energy-coupling factor transport system ATP-binding protein